MKKEIIKWVIIFAIIYILWYISASKHTLDKYYICKLDIDNTLKCVHDYKWIDFKILK